VECRWGGRAGSQKRCGAARSEPAWGARAAQGNRGQVIHFPSSGAFRSRPGLPAVGCGGYGTVTGGWHHRPPRECTAGSCACPLRRNCTPFRGEGERGEGRDVEPQSLLRCCRLLPLGCGWRAATPVAGTDTSVLRSPDKSGRSYGGRDEGQGRTGDTPRLSSGQGRQRGTGGTAGLGSPALQQEGACHAPLHWAATRAAPTIRDWAQHSAFVAEATSAK